MKPKTIVTAVLLLFVGASIVYLAVKETGDKPVRKATQPSTASAAVEQEAPTSAPSESRTATSKVVAYYFHGNVRCMTCRSIEAYAKEAVESGFPVALEGGRIEFRVVNVEETGNGHFVQDYQLTTRSVVLVEFAADKQKRWKNLGRVWELVRRKDAFLKYVREETQDYLEVKN